MSKAQRNSGLQVQFKRDNTVNSENQWDFSDLFKLYLASSNTLYIFYCIYFSVNDSFDKVSNSVYLGLKLKRKHYYFLKTSIHLVHVHLLYLINIHKIY